MRKVLTVLAVIVLVIAIGFGVGQWLTTTDSGQPDGSGDAADQGGLLAQQPQWCPAVEVISVPGTAESRADRSASSYRQSELAATWRQCRFGLVLPQRGCEGVTTRIRLRFKPGSSPTISPTTILRRWVVMSLPGRWLSCTPSAH